MRNVVGFLTLLMAASCTTPQEMAQLPPIVFHSSEPVPDATYCLARENQATSEEKSDGSRHIDAKNMYGRPALMFDVYPEGSGSRVEYRRAKNTIGGTWKRCLGPHALGSVR